MAEQYGHSPYVPRGHTPRDLGDAVLRAYAERNDRHPRIAPTFQREFDRKALTGRLAEILDEVATR